MTIDMDVHFSPRVETPVSRISIMFGPSDFIITVGVYSPNGMRVNNSRTSLAFDFIAGHWMRGRRTT